ncbi:MarR family transcriptional regulator [Rothia terrae]|uniref:MarR family transcriptional regulator n=1 Tax=Rothia terrae TaxID=396015 RepID=A0A7H2BCY1_9MICC|nr:MarR family transcriptional regulator [Rothia terrae]NKZ33729.1 MarR family transcriptional regulator [Rothia terrae]QNV37527.1 MarR family transcriptional regulator [Rothia terrae]
MSTTELSLDKQLCFSLYRTSRAITRAYHELLTGLNLTYPQYLVMLVMWEAKEPVAMRDLTQQVELDSGTLTPLIKRLIAAGYLEKQRDPADERRTVLFLTASGKELEEKAAPIPRKIYEMCSVDGMDLALIKRELDRLADHLGDPA